MPTVLRWRGYDFYFWSNERNEPPHIHVDKDDCSAKFWLEPLSLAASFGFPDREARRLLRTVEEHRVEFLEAWYEHFDEAR